MIIIAHRGNLDGPSFYENRRTQIEKALVEGFNVEIDVWFSKHSKYLLIGHDSGNTEELDPKFYSNDRVWWHAKTPEALVELLNRGMHCFMHDRDIATLTSRGFIWTFPGEKLTHRSVAVLPERTSELGIAHLKNCAAICTDHPLRYRDMFNE